MSDIRMYLGDINLEVMGCVLLAYVIVVFCLHGHELLSFVTAGNFYLKLLLGEELGSQKAPWGSRSIGWEALAYDVARSV
jgi:hypothetical protein